MIVGVAAKVVPTLNGVDGRRLSRAVGAVLLINAGCLLRVGGQTLTDFTPSAFPVAGVSGLLEVARPGPVGRAPVAGHGGPGPHAALTPRPSQLPPLEDREIRATDTVAAVLNDEPRLLGTFLAAGFSQLASPLCQKLGRPRGDDPAGLPADGQDIEAFVADLNAARQRCSRARIAAALHSACSPEGRSLPCRLTCPSTSTDRAICSNR